MKPSDSIMQIFSQIRGKDDSEKAEELVRAVMIYLDEQAESQEPKSLEECKHGRWYVVDGSCFYCGKDLNKPQEEPKKCSYEDPCDECLNKSIQVYAGHQKETEPKKCWCGHTDGHVLNTNVPFIKSQE